MNKLSYLEYVVLSSFIKKIDHFGQKNLKPDMEDTVRQIFLSMWSKELIKNKILHLDDLLSKNELDEIKTLLNSEEYSGENFIQMHKEWLDKVNLLMNFNYEFVFNGSKQFELSISRRGYFVSPEYGLGIHALEYYEKLSNQKPDRPLNSKEIAYLADQLTNEDVEYLRYLLR